MPESDFSISAFKALSPSSECLMSSVRRANKSSLVEHIEIVYSKEAILIMMALVSTSPPPFVFPIPSIKAFNFF